MSTNDVIKNSILDSISGGDYLNTSTILGILFFAVLIGIYIYAVYRFSSKSAFYSKDLNIAMAGMPILVAAIMVAMQANLIVSLGMVGALSIVRFRTAVKNPLDLMYLFWAVSAGIICGVNLKVLALIVSAAMTVLILLLQLLPSIQAPMVLVLRSNEADADWKKIKDCVKSNTKAAKQKAAGRRTRESARSHCHRDPRRARLRLSFY